ncbi:DotU family type IV/VI secretion system protein [Nannocystis pusilla]|uniref:DotU family type IV/VI secretion system protein n=1 Tax=Nannocystis pusilla TaxID=889268 RepID=A0A9X3EZN9_9BACT|nr:DotU family type IV/VI secretion system protein [Nannocystis pusilla]
MRCGTSSSPSAGSPSTSVRPTTRSAPACACSASPARRADPCPTRARGCGARSPRPCPTSSCCSGPPRPAASTRTSSGARSTGRSASSGSTSRRALGFTAEHVLRARVALVTAADEFSQRPGSHCDYSAPPPAGEMPLLQQKYFNNRTDLGNRFFDELKAIIDKHSPSPVEHAVLEVFALCVALGVRGMYESYDLDGYEAIRARLFAKLRPTLAIPDGPPAIAPAPWPASPRSGRLLLWVAGFTLLFAGALLYTHRVEVARNAAELRRHLDDLLAPDPAQT